MSKPSGKQIDCFIKLQIPAGKANPAPPVGTALGPKGLNIMDFCRSFNDKTSSLGDSVVPVVITVYKDKTFTFITKKPPVPNLIKKELNLTSGSKEPGRNIVTTITMAQARKIAEFKMEDLNCYDVDMAIRMVCGTARSMGIDVVE